MKLCWYLLLVCVLGAQTVSAENWPFWRGPSRQGISQEKGLPLQWSQNSNVVWKVAIPGESWSSPVVYGDRIFITTTLDAGASCHVLSVDRKTGSIQWNTNVFEQVPLRKEGRNSYATPTPATDGKSVFAVFGDGSVVALKADTGEVLWQHREVKFYSQHGLGASPILHNDRLIMPFDGSSTGENKRVGWQLPWDQSYLLAFQTGTGKVLWKASRGQSRIAHVTPNVFSQDGKDLLVSGAGDVIQAFDLENGKKLWSVYSKGEGVVPSVVIGKNLAYTVSGFEDPTVRAVRLPKEGEEPKIAWEQKKSVPMISSMVYVDEYVDDYLFGITDGGVAICLKANNGEIVWQERIGGKHSSSPVWIERKIYFLSEEGETTVIEASPTFKVLARSPLEEPTQASMAVASGQLFIRTAQHLYCIAQK